MWENILALAVSATLFVPQESSWTGRAGPSGDFRLHESTGLTETFGEWGPELHWSRPLGDGYSGLLFEDGRLFTQFREDEEEVVVALSAQDGKTLWEYRFPVECYPDMDRSYGLGPNATPLISGERLFTVSIDGQLHCHDKVSGELVWRVDLHERYGRQERREEYGFSASPIEFDGNIIVLIGGDAHAAVALDPSDGTQIWGSAARRVSYAQPILIELDDGAQLVFFSPTAVIGMDPTDGKLLWEHPVECFTENNLTPALYLGDRHLWVASQLDGGTRVLWIPPREAGAGEGPQVLWESKRIKQAHWDSFAEGDFVYGSLGGNSSSFLSGVNWKTGDVAWKHRGFHLAKGVLADGKFYFLDENGQVGIARFSPSGVEILAANQLTERVSWTPPTLVGSVLYVRDRVNLMAVDLAQSSYADADEEE